MITKPVIHRSLLSRCCLEHLEQHYTGPEWRGATAVCCGCGEWYTRRAVGWRWNPDQDVEDDSGL